MGRRGDRMILQYKYIRTRYIRAATRPQQARRTPGKINCSFFPVFFFPLHLLFFSFPCALNTPTVCAVDFTLRGRHAQVVSPAKQMSVSTRLSIGLQQNTSGSEKYQLNVFIQTPKGSTSHGEKCDQRLDPPPPTSCTTLP